MDPSFPSGRNSDAFPSDQTFFSSSYPPTPPRISPIRSQRSFSYSVPTLARSNEAVLAMTQRREQSSSNGPEGPIAVPLSSLSFHNLMDKLHYHDRDRKFPRYFFDAVRSEMIVQLRPSPLHGNVPSIFLDGFLPIKSSLPTAIKDRIGVDIDVNTNGFHFTMQEAYGPVVY